MRVGNISKIGSAVPATNVPTTTETVVATVSGVSTQSPDGVVIIEALVNLTAGTGTTAVNLRIRRGTDTTGTVVGPVIAGPPLAAGTGSADIQVSDTPGEVASLSYVLTVQQSSASANGTINGGSIQATY